LYVLLGGATLEHVLVLALGMGRGLQQLATAMVKNRDSFQEGWQQAGAQFMHAAPVLALAGVAALVIPR
jgi:hypothetical protein